MSAETTEAAATANLAETAAALRGIGVTTVYEAAGRTGLLDHDFIPVVPGPAAGPARTAMCGQDDNRAVHEAVAHLQPGEVLVVTMPEPRPIGVIGELLVTQMIRHGAAGLVVDAAVRDVDELAKLGLPISARWIRSHGATKDLRGRVGEPVTIGGATVATGDIVILDRDGVVAVPAARADEVLAASRARVEKESAARAGYEQGALSYDQHGFRAEDERNVL